MTTYMSALRTACWELARKEQEGTRRLQRQMGAFFEGLGNIVVDIENARLSLDNPVALQEALTDCLERNVYNNTKA